jgi:probable rRNA maturation factor
VSVKVEFVQGSKLWRGALPARALAKAAIAAAVAESEVKLRRGAEVSVHLIDDAAIRDVNAQWRQKDAPTNVLSFPAADPSALAEARLLGDILVAFETVAREAKDDGKSLDGHFSHLVIHGFLHLLGFDHIEPEEAEEMEALERRALARLGIADPYAERELLAAVR